MIIKSQQTGKELRFTSEISSGGESKLLITSFGPHGSGKSRFGATGPEIIGGIFLDRKTRFSFKKTAEELGKRFLLPEIDFVREANPMIKAGMAEMYQAGESEIQDGKLAEITNKTKKHYRAHVNMVKDYAFALHAHKDVQIIMIDLFGQFYQDVRYAHYGRTGHVFKKIEGAKGFQDTSQADTELIDFINIISDKHLILTHKDKDEYVKNVPTGRRVWDGFKYMGNHTNLVIEHVVNKKWKPESENENEQWHFGLYVQKSLHMPDLEVHEDLPTLMDDFISFPNLAQMVFPNRSLKDFQ